MVDLTQQEIVALALLADREREARRLLRLQAARSHPRVRSGLAAWLARLALSLDREAAELSLCGDVAQHVAGRPSG